jgi:hypothetical protein
MRGVVRPIIAIGGPAVNQFTHSNMKHGRVEGINLRSYSHTIIDGEDVFQASKGEKPDAPVEIDCGLTICMTVPKAKQRIAMLFGMWPSSTEAAGQLFLGQLSPTGLTFRFAWALKRGKDALAINEVLPIGTGKRKPVIVKQRVVVFGEGRETEPATPSDKVKKIIVLNADVFRGGLWDELREAEERGMPSVEVNAGNLLLRLVVQTRRIVPSDLNH